VAAGNLLCAEPTCGFLLAGVILDHWQVASYLGRGPMADLYLARAIAPSVSGLSAMVVKVLRAPTVRPLAHLEQQLGQLLTLRHPHIHPLTGMGWTSHDGGLYLLSPFAELGSLARTPGASGPLPPLAVASIVRQIADALQFAHEHQIVHGRLKPDNCLLATPATVQVSDFYSCLLDPAARTTGDSFAAPEQAAGRADAASDQFALALLTYRLLVGRPDSDPHASLGSPAAGLMLRPASDWRPDLPRQIDQALGRALSRQARDRYPSVTDFAIAFQDGLETTPRGQSSPFPGAFAARPSAMSSQPVPIIPRRSFSPGPLTPVCTLPGHTSPARVLAWAPNSTQLASAGEEQGIRLWSIQHGIGLPGATLAGHGGNVLALSWSADGTMLASGGADATVRTWLLVRGATHTAWWGHNGSVTAVGWSPDGTWLASGGADRTIRLWDREGRAAQVWTAHGHAVTALAWSPDETILASGGADRLIHLWDPLANAPRAAFSSHTDEIRHLAWSPDGTLLASYAAKKDQRVCLWQWPSQRLAAVLDGHGREIIGLFWASDGTWLASASADGTIRYWNTYQHLGEPLGPPLHLSSPPLSMAGSPASSLVALGRSDLLIQIMQLQRTT
jgi:eukaryotic-like serine/threonine-protein kinase